MCSKSVKGVWVILLMLAMTVMLGATATVLAEDNSEAQSLDEMVVTATRSSERKLDVPVITEVITREKIEMSGTTHLGDLLAKYVTGHYQKYNGLLSPVGLRGFQTEAHGDDVKGYVLILVDGHRVGTGNAAKINLDRIERVEVTKGPASALYGSAAIGGVVNLITKKGEGDLQGTVSAEYGSFNYVKGQVSTQAEINEKVRFHLTASNEDIDDYKDPEFGQVYNTAEHKKNIGGNITYAFNDNHELRLGGNFGDLTGEYPSWENGTYSNYDEDYGAHYDKSHGYADLEYNGSFLGGKLAWRGLGYYLWDRNHWYWGATDADADQTKYTDKTLGTDQQFTYRLASWNKFLFGFNLEKLEKESEAISNNLPALPYTPSMEYTSKALFVQDSMDLLNNRINIIAAGRYDNFELTTKKPATGQLLNINERTEEFSHFSPKLGIGVKFLDELLRVRANLGEGFKSPSADQLSAMYENMNGQRYLGNPDLNPETSMTYDLGLDLFHDYFTVNVGYFHTDYRDKIIQTTTAYNGQNWITWKNSGDAEIAGFDINLNWAVGRTFGWTCGLNLWANTTFNTKCEDKETGEDLLWVSDYEIKSGIDFSYDGFSTQFTYTLVGPQMIYNYDSYPYRTEKKEEFSFCDLTMRYRFLDSWEASLAVLNIFNDTVEWVRGYPMAERNFRLGLSYTF